MRDLLRVKGSGPILLFFISKRKPTTEENEYPKAKEGHGSHVLITSSDVILHHY